MCLTSPISSFWLRQQPQVSRILSMAVPAQVLPTHLKLTGSKPPACVFLPAPPFLSFVFLGSQNHVLLSQQPCLRVLHTQTLLSGSLATSSLSASLFYIWICVAISQSGCWVPPFSSNHLTSWVCHNSLGLSPRLCPTTSSSFCPFPRS